MGRGGGTPPSLVYSGKWPGPPPQFCDLGRPSATFLTPESNKSGPGGFFDVFGGTPPKTRKNPPKPDFLVLGPKNDRIDPKFQNSGGGGPPPLPHFGPPNRSRIRLLEKRGGTPPLFEKVDPGSVSGSKNVKKW